MKILHKLNVMNVEIIPKYTFHHTTPVHRKLRTYFQYNKMRKISLRFPFQRHRRWAPWSLFHNETKTFVNCTFL